MSDCPRFGRLFGGCRFEARYDEVPRRCDIEGRMTAEEMREMLIIRVYVHDICIRCGKTLK